MRVSCPAHPDMDTFCVPVLPCCEGDSFPTLNRHPYAVTLNRLT